MAVLKKRSTPGVYRDEEDRSNIIRPAGTSTGGVVVRARKGRINMPLLVSNDQEYISNFGEPVFTSGASLSDTLTPEMGYGQYAALEFLQESSSLYVVRDYDTGDAYASVTYELSGNPVTSGIAASSDPNNADDLDSIYTLDNANITGKSLLIAPIGPGLDGNNIAVTIQTASSACDWWNAYDTYTSASDLSARPIGQYVFKINVYTKKTEEDWNVLSFATYSASPVETWYGTRTSLQDGNKNQLLISDVVNGNSDLIYVVPGTVNFDTTSLTATPTSATPLAGGTLKYGTNISSSDGWSYFTNREDVTVNILICPTYTMAVKKAVATIAANRKDCIVACQSGTRARTTVASVKSDETYGYKDPSYVSLYTGWDKYYDKYNDKNVWIPKCIYGAALMARTDVVANVWDAPMGVNRGILTSNGQFKLWSFNQIGQLYDSNINTSRNMRGYGDVMWGQKTAQLKASALDRVNVRRLLLFIEDTVETALLPFIGEPNSDETRLRVFNIIDSFLAGLNSQGAFNTSNGVGYQCVVDTSNNTPQVIDNNTLAVDIFIKPQKTVEFIQLTTIILRSGVSISEVVGG